MFGGIDLGGTKIEARLFDEQMQEVKRQRIATPTESYEALFGGLQAQIEWLLGHENIEALGLGTPGLIDPANGAVRAANLPLLGHRLGFDLERAIGVRVAVLKDCHAFALSEATMGAGKGKRSVVGLIIGTGIAGGYVVDQKLLPDLNGQQGEYGHLPLPADLVAKYELPLLQCGCGLTGCFETYLAGPGLSRLAEVMTGQVLDAPTIMATMVDVRNAWVDIAASLMALLARALDPEAVVLGGGLGTAPGTAMDIRRALAGKILGGTNLPEIVPAEHGDASGALGAALFARQNRR